MKIATTLIVAASFATIYPAFADSSTPQDSGIGYSSAATSQIGSPARGKTRAEVYAELIQAQKDGLIPSSKSDYPPSEATIRRNRELYQLGRVPAN
ncbi:MULTISPECIES: DUF4148 domain-containing protein [Burkholderia cepacia complex]|uniref:DUF4148 domain-containing protein n=1 Tax=Burkholderia cenocepacia TaxID=95486 RepID=A0ABD4UG82_9BURK|nr:MULTISPECIES: DUF4148 domain-containing protein [Burkholderia cepacia complex]MCW3696650.1 DUF4148 domain-containing protein [Burkholderia cenocepacia]MCW3704866.1 DUF4148 domain-containing protein [Burkholderia cenocepacia]MCW3713126.1 DUF4148 domain-containing protein [Burkholderia cenocepacia]MCW3725219.1 DUF4148 domain-containing protein [Burkholderia cenocepacia]MCW3729118.1 DUF4148 domain-containing protein [Burkholderia cenocepacia]